ncbi:NUDIX hydrolase [Agrobacterium burrii]
MTIGLAHAELIAVVTAITRDEPRVMTVRAGAALPSGPFEFGHRTLQSGLREWIHEQTHHPVGYLEQLYTFADRDRNNDIPGGRTISIGYLGLVREHESSGNEHALWHGWYEYLPWEDHRQGRPAVLDTIIDRLRAWADSDPACKSQRHLRADFTFGLDGGGWNEELTLQRYELLYEAGLVEEAQSEPRINFGRPMFADHRRILATGIARLRAKIKYRPVVFELMADTFTLLQLQRAIEALAGLTLHKQNFRRLIEQQQLVEETGDMTSETGGRPAKLFRFRQTVLDERALSGTKLPLSRN